MFSKEAFLYFLISILFLIISFLFISILSGYFCHCSDLHCPSNNELKVYLA